MSRKLTRREIIKLGAGAAALSIVNTARGGPRITVEDRRPVRVGIVGVGCRGILLQDILLNMEGVEINALADINQENLSRAANSVERKRGRRPATYSEGPQDFRRLVARDDLDAVICATPWDTHTPVAVAAMRAKKYIGVEVPAAVSVEECWELVNTSERTGMPCMMLENVCYFRDMLMVLNMVRDGLFGELVHCESGYQHDIRLLEGCPGSGYFDHDGELRWRGYVAERRNALLYPTHQVGPVAQYLNIERGDRFTHLVSMSSKTRGMNHWIKKKFGPDHKNANRKFALGDINTTLIKTANGCTVTLYHDTSLPRPYDLIFRVQGVDGLYMDNLKSIYIEGKSPKDHEWESVENYRQKYEHPLWRGLGDVAKNYGHGGSDYITVHQFIKAVRARTQTPQDVYDAATWSVIFPLSEVSLARGSNPVNFPDFTRGKWKTRPPVPIVGV